MNKKIAGYTRISVDDSDFNDVNQSIENQKKVIQEFVAKRIPDYKLDLYEDLDRSGYYSFEKRPLSLSRFFEAV